MTNYIFDLYGTLIDIHTSESKASLWKEVALLRGLQERSGRIHHPLEHEKKAG